MKLQPRFIIAVAASILLGVGASVPAQTQQEVREAKKIAKEQRKALRNEQKKEAKEIRKALKPGTKPVEGKDQIRGEVEIANLDPHDLGLTFADEGTGVIIDQIDAKSRFADLDLRAGDRVLAVDGRKVGDQRQFMKHLLAEDVRGGRVAISIQREDADHEILVAPAELLEHLMPRKGRTLAKLGITLGTEKHNRLRVADISPQTPAAEAGVHRADEIVAFDGQEISSPRKLNQVIRDAEPGEYELVVARDEAEKN